MKFILLAVLLLSLAMPFAFGTGTAYATDNTTIGMTFSENISIGNISVSAGDSFAQSIREAMNDAMNDFLNSTMGKIISMAFTIVIIIVLSLWAFKSRYPVAFQLLSAISLIAGFRWYDSFGTTDALAISLGLIAFSFCMGGTALYTMLAAPRESEE